MKRKGLADKASLLSTQPGMTSFCVRRAQKMLMRQWRVDHLLKF